MVDKEESNKQQGTWKDMLEEYTKAGLQKSADQQEKEATELFLEIINEQKSDISENIPRFYFKKAINYNDLYFSIKTEAKSRFLSVKSFEIPQKKRTILSNIINRPERPLDGIKIKPFTSSG